jgi:hypothetical protein
VLVSQGGTGEALEPWMLGGLVVAQDVGFLPGHWLGLGSSRGQGSSVPSVGSPGL